MKYILNAVLLISILSCSNNHDKNTIQNSNELNNQLTSQPKVDSFKMNYLFKEDDVYRYKITTLSTTSQEILSDSSLYTASKQKVEYSIKLSVEKVDTVGNAKINIIVESIDVNGSVNGQEVVYNSRLIQSTQERMMFAHYEAIKKKRFSIDITNTGDVIKIYNSEAIVEELLVIQQQSNNTTAKQKLELNENFVVSVLRPLSEQIFRNFPEENVSVNYSWNDKYFSQYALFQIENIATFQIIDVSSENTDSIVSINASLAINWKGENKATENGMSFYFHPPVVSGNGSIQFNKKQGLISYSNTSTNMQMETDISGVDQKNTPFKAKRTDNTTNTNIVELIN